MSKRVLPALYLCLLSLPAWSQTLPESASVAAPPAAATATAAPEPEGEEPVPQTILVSGSRPGPGLWKVSKGEHVLWVFGNYWPLPAKMEWRSRDIEKIIANSQEYVKPPNAEVSVGVFGGLAALPFLVGAKKNPGGAELKDLLPPDVYARWQPLKQQYFADDNGIERERPGFVASALSDRALKAAGLTSNTEVAGTINGIVKKYKLKVTDPTVNEEIKSPGKAVREFKKSSLDDVPCLSKTIEQLEKELGTLSDLANAWAVGEIDSIRKRDYSARTACMNAVTSSSLVKGQPELLTLQARAAAAWVDAAEKALAANKSTFTMVHIKEILDPKGVIATLQAKGYTVEAPK